MARVEVVRRTITRILLMAMADYPVKAFMRELHKLEDLLEGLTPMELIEMEMEVEASGLQ